MTDRDYDELQRESSKVSVASEKTLDNLSALQSPSSLASPVQSPKHKSDSEMDRNLGPEYRPGSSRPPHHMRDVGDQEYDQRRQPRHEYDQDRQPTQSRTWDSGYNVRRVDVSPDTIDKNTSEFTFEYKDGAPVVSPKHEEMPRVLIGSESSPVRRLKRKEEDRTPRVERELSDAYIDEITRTPRYEYGRHKTYDDMITSMDPDDPFKGHYLPSGKVPQGRNTLPKPKRKSKKVRSGDEETIPLDSVNSKKKSKKKKKQKGEESAESTGTFTVESHVNAGYHMSPSHLKADAGKQVEPDRASVKSTGTYTLGDSKSQLELSGNLAAIKPPVLKRQPMKVKSMTQDQQDHSSKRDEMDTEALVKYVQTHDIFQRECKVYVRNQKTESDCMCGRNREWHESRNIPTTEPTEYEPRRVWHHKTHSLATPTDSFGVIQFQGFGQESSLAPYVRLCPTTDLELVWTLLTEHWKLPIPNLLISVTGGAQRFDLNPRLKAVFKRGLINAATTTGAWIITGGTATGVMQFVGEAVRDHMITLGSNDKTVVALGIASWGCVANRSALDGEGDQGLFNAQYCLEDLCETIKGKDVPLDHNHTHFIMVDDGTEGHFGKEIEFRAQLERYLSEKVETGVAESQSVNVPVVMLVVEGGVNTMKTMWQSIQQDIPVLVLNGSGRAADFIACGYLLSKDLLNEDKTKYPSSFDEDMKSIAREKFAWKPTDNVEKKIAECIKQLRDTLEKRRLVNIFNLSEADTKDIDRAILYALLKANKTNANAQLSLAMAWNRCDIARHEIFTQDNRKYWKNISLYDAMFTALVQDRVDFVQLFMENGVSIKKFLSIETLWNLYANVLLDTSDSTAQLIKNLMMYLKVCDKCMWLDKWFVGVNDRIFIKQRTCEYDQEMPQSGITDQQSWTAYLCCRETNNDGNDPELLDTVGKLLVHLLGDEAMNPYQDPKFRVERRNPVLKWLAGNHESKPGGDTFRGTGPYSFRSKAQGKQRSVCGSKEESVDAYAEAMDRFPPQLLRRKRREYDFNKFPERELFYWAVLFNRKELAKMFWKSGQDQLGSALVACSVLKGLSGIADDDEELELSTDLLDHANTYEDMATGVLSEGYKRDKQMAHQLLVRRLEHFGKTTLFTLADTNTLMTFMGHTSCQTKLNLIWKGRMALYTQTWKILMSLVLFFCIPMIKFTTNNTSSVEPEDDEDYDDLEDELPETEKPKADVHVLPGAKKMPDGDLEQEVFVRAKSKRRKRNVKKKLYKVQFFSDIRTNSIGVFSAIYFFYTAPVTVFIANTISYLTFLGLFTYFLLTNLYPEVPSSIEYVVWVWTVTMALEELRQITSRDQRSLWYKVRNWFGSMWNRFDLGMYLIFILSVVLRYVLRDENFVYARITYSVTLSMYYLRFMQTFFAEKNIGPKVIMIRNMMVDLLFFFFIFAVFLLSFGVAYQANLYPNSPPSWYLLKSVIYIPYWQMYGELFLENMEGETPANCISDESVWRASGGVDRCPEPNALVPLLAAVYLLLTNVLLVNLLIAMFSYTFQMVQDRSEQVWRFYRYSLVYEYYDRPMLVPPLIVISHIYRTLLWCTRKTCSTKKYHNEFKLNLDEKDNNRLTLFERTATENYLNISQKLAKEELNSKVSDTAERIEKVIEDLENIKETVNHQKAFGDEGLLDTARPESVTPLTHRRSVLDSNMEAFQARLSDLGEQVAKNSIQMTQMMQMVQSMMTQQRVRPSQLEIRDMTSVSDAENK